MDVFLDAVDEKGWKLDNEEIINILVMYLNAGHGSSSQISTGANLLL